MVNKLLLDYTVSYIRRLYNPHIDLCEKLKFLIVIILLYAFFWVIPRRLNFICRRFGTLCLFHLHRRISMKMEEKECSETPAYKIQTPRNCPEENIQHSEHGENLKSRIVFILDPINQPNRCKNFSTSLLEVYVQLNVFWASSRP